MSNNNNSSPTFSNLVEHALRLQPVHVVANPNCDTSADTDIGTQVFIRSEILFMRHVRNCAWGVINYYFFVDTEGNTYVHNTTDFTGELDKITSMEEFKTRISTLPVLKDGVIPEKDMQEVKEELRRLKVTNSDYEPSSYCHTGIVAMDAGEDKLYLVDKNLVSKPLLLSCSGDYNIINDGEQFLVLIPRLKGLLEIPF